MKAINLIILILVITVATYTVYGQGQPQVQQISVRSPEGMKIDGKLDEWPSPNLNAYNPADRIYYVVSNDNDNLYFTIRGAGNGVAKKAIAGGMVLTIARAADQKSSDHVTMLFPLPQKFENVTGIMGVVNQIAGWTYDPVANRKQIDSIAAVANLLLDKTVKEVGIHGIKEISDPVISKYNELGIKTEIKFFRMQPIIEMSIPLKYLGSVLNNTDKIRYNIKLNAVPEESSSPDVKESIANGNVNPNIGFALNPTDFWGEYILAKKPQ